MTGTTNAIFLVALMAFFFDLTARVGLISSWLAVLISVGCLLIQLALFCEKRRMR